MDNTKLIEERISKDRKSSIIFLFKLFKYVFSSAKVMCTLFLGLNILLSITRPIIPLIWKAYIEKVNSDTELLTLIILITSFYLLKIIEELLRRYTQSYEDIERLDKVQHHRFQELVNTKLYKKLTSLSPENLEVAKVNDLITRVFDFTSDAWDGLNREVMVQGYYIIAKLIAIISIGVTLFIIEPTLVFIILLAAIPTLYTTYIGEKISFKFNKENSQLKREIQYFEDLLVKEAPKEIKSLDLFDFFYNKWKTRSDKYLISEKKIQLKQSLIMGFNDVVQSIATVSSSVFAIVLMTKGIISIATLAAVFVLVNNLSLDIHALFKAIGKFLSKKNEATIFFDLLELPGQEDEGKNITEVDINTKNLCYRYPFTDRLVIDDLNVEIRKGEKVALVGENGAGKTTFVKLISGMIKPTSGELLIDDQKVEDINPINHYEQLSAVFQDPARYTSFTISDNVYFANPRDRNEDEINNALMNAGLEFKDTNVMLGKDIGGTELSGGQWQKLAIARAYYRDKDFIILDEPTSNLDPIAETEIFKKYIEMSQDKTVIMVTHRISVAAIADRIIVFDEGKIVEDGSHNELMELNGKYANLYKVQADWYDR